MIYGTLIEYGQIQYTVMLAYIRALCNEQPLFSSLVRELLTASLTAVDLTLKSFLTCELV